MKKFFLISLLALVGCTSLSKREASKITFSKVQTLRVGAVSEQDILNYLGPASLEIAFDDEGIETWSYFDEITKYQRLNLNFHASSKILDSVQFFVKNGDKERDASNIAINFPKNHFEKETVQQQTVDFSYEENSLRDDSSGLVLTFGTDDRYITTIFMWKPGTPNASAKKVETVSPRIIVDRRSASNVRQAN